MPASDRPNGNYASREYVNPLFEQMQDVRNDVGALFTTTSKIKEEQGKTDWKTILSALGILILLIGALWGLVASPINSDIRDLKEYNRDQKTPAVVTFQRLTALEIANAKQETQIAAQLKTIDTFRDLIRRLENESVNSKDYSKDVLVIQRQLDALAKKVDDVFPPSKTFEEITTRLRALENRTAVPPVVQQR